MGTSINSEDPDEMPHYAAFHRVYTVTGKNNHQGKKCIMYCKIYLHSHTKNFFMYLGTIHNNLLILSCTSQLGIGFSSLFLSTFIIMLLYALTEYLMGCLLYLGP